MRIFDEIFVDKTKYGTKIKTDDYQEYGLYPIIDQGQKQIAGYTDLSEGVFTDVPAIIFGDHTRIIKYVDKPFFIGADGVKILKSNLENANYKYLYYALLNAKIPNTGYNRHFKWLKQLKFSCPDLDRQKSIVNILDKIKIVIDFRTKQLEKYDELIKARFVEMFGDPVENPKGYYVATLKELIDKEYITYHLDGNHGGNYPKSEEFVDIGIPYISANCIVNGEIDFSKAKYLTPERASKLRKGIAQDEDVLFAHNATVGPVVVLHTDEEKVILGTSLTAYRCNKKVIIPNYLKLYMLSDGFIRQYSSEMKQTTRNQVPITVQKKYKFLIPPIEEQRAFADFVKQIDKSKFVEEKNLIIMCKIKRSLYYDQF